MNPRNSWYVAAWDHEVQRLKLVRRILLGEPVVLYRKSDGAPVALEDRCCHRHAPLSHGRLRGDRLECGYHGLQFDPSGACVHIPAQDSIPASARVRSYPVVERYHWIWIWMGDPALADTAIPANEIPVDYRIEPDRILVDRWVLDTPVPPYFRLLAKFAKDERVDRWMNTVFTPPSFVRIDIGAARAGTGAREGDRSRGITTWNLNAITPETERSSHYFWAQAQNFSQGDPSITELDFQLVHTAFQEDLKMIKGQQQNIDLAPEAPRLNLASDRAGIQARRMVERLVREEQARAG